jgi:hypothetical protein
VQSRNLDAELAPVARLGERNVTYMELDIELGVLDPVRPVERERDFTRRRRKCGNCSIRDEKKRRIS